jgi:C4-type Zn-finger protein
MGKSHRGRAAKGTRAQCPVCSRTGVKLMYPITFNGKANTMVCKQCRTKAAS